METIIQNYTRNKKTKEISLSIDSFVVYINFFIKSILNLS